VKAFATHAGEGNSPAVNVGNKKPDDSEDLRRRPFKVRFFASRIVSRGIRDERFVVASGDCRLADFFGGNRQNRCESDERAESDVIPALGRPTNDRSMLSEHVAAA